MLETQARGRDDNKDGGTSLRGSAETIIKTMAMG